MFCNIYEWLNELDRWIYCIDITDFILLNFWCFNATFNNILAISWRPVLVVEEAEVPGKNHRRMGKQLENFITCGC
jgi:hypothetical protein